MFDYSNVLNLNEFQVEASGGKYQIPLISSESGVPEKLMDFCRSLRSSQFSCGVHFFLDDYRFERLWRMPWRYIPHLKKFSAVLSPDFSLYSDMPQAMKIWNVYRSRLLGQMMRRAGCRVIPTVSWADAGSYEYCFDGITPGGTVAVSTVGAMYSKVCRSLFFQGFEAMTARLKPKTIIVYGGVPAGIGSEKYEIISYPNTSLTWKSGRRGVSYREKR